MAKYRKKPVVIEAVQFDIREKSSKYPMVIEGVGSFGEFVPFIETLKGRMIISDGDFIIRGINGEYYPCKPDIFEKTYEKVDE